jgi:putative peptidoglycan lipid II flippase
MAQSLQKKVGIAALIMMGSVFLSRLIGLLREMVIAYIGGAGGEVDAYQVAFVVPEILNHMLASGFLSVTFIPIFTKYLAQDREEEGWRIFSLIFIGFGSLLLLFILAAFFFAPDIIELVARGRSDPAFKVVAVRMTRIIIPAQFFFFCGGLLMAVQFAKEKFLVPALAPLVYNVGIIIGGVILGSRIGMEGFSWGVLIGAFVGNFAIQWWGACRVGLKITLFFDLRHPDLKKYILLTLPLMVGLTMIFSMEIFMRFFGAYLPPGGIAGLNYGRTILLIPVGLFGQAVGVASFPFMARLFAENKMQQMNTLLNNSLRYLSLVIPFSVVLMVLRYEVVQILFERGRFDADATALTAHILMFLLPGAFALSAYTVVVRGYHAMQNTLFPAIFGTVAVVLSLPLYWYGLKLIGAGGIALAISLSSVFQVVLLYALWNRRSDNFESKAVYRFYIKIIAISAAIGIVMEWLRTRLLSGIGADTFAGSVTVCIVIGLAFTAVLLAAGHVFKIREIRDFYKRFFKQKNRKA